MPMSPKQVRRMEAKALRRNRRYARQAVAIFGRTGSISQACIELGKGIADGIAAGIRTVADLSSTMRAASRFQAGLTKRGLRRR